MPLPASIICLIASGASSGGSATPLPSATAVSTAFDPPLAGVFPRTAADAARVGLESTASSPGSAAAVDGAGEDDCTPPATGATDRARDSVGSGGSETASSDCAATTGDAVGATGAVGAAATTGVTASCPAAPSAK